MSEENQNKIEDLNQQEAPKKRRGRPPKAKIEKEEIFAETEESKPKRRGRPPRSKLQEEADREARKEIEALQKPLQVNSDDDPVEENPETGEEKFLSLASSSISYFIQTRRKKWEEDLNRLFNPLKVEGILIDTAQPTADPVIAFFKQRARRVQA